MSAANVTLSLLCPEVMEITAMRQTIEKPHIDWLVGYAPERDEDNLGRVVFGTLHAAGTDGFAEVTVACVMGYSVDAEPGTDEFRKLLKKSDALEALYDVARIAFRSATAVTDVEVTLPRKAPNPKMSELVRAGENSESARTTAKDE